MATLPTAAALISARVYHPGGKCSASFALFVGLGIVSELIAGALVSLCQFESSQRPEFLLDKGSLPVVVTYH